MHSDERDAPVQPVWSRLRLVAEESSWFAVLSPDLDTTGRHRSWGRAATAASSCLPAETPPHPPGGGCFPTGCPRGVGHNHGVDRQMVGASGEGEASRTLHGFASPTAKAAEISFLSWFESRARGAKRQLLAGWKTGERERKRRLRP